MSSYQGRQGITADSAEAEVNESLEQVFVTSCARLFLVLMLRRVPAMPCSPEVLGFFLYL